MTQILVAALMWVLVVSLLIVRRKRADRSITYASITIAVAMTLNVDAVYAAIDPVLGGTNIATLIADTLLMVGLFFLAEESCMLASTGPGSCVQPSACLPCWSHWPRSR